MQRVANREWRRSAKRGKALATKGMRTAVVVQIFRCEGEYWTIAYEGVVCRLRDTKGLQHLAHLLRRPQMMVPAFVLDGHDGRTADDAARERARVNVTRAINAAMKRIEENHPALAAHLGGTVHTGFLCTYRPDPRLPIEWE